MALTEEELKAHRINCYAPRSDKSIKRTKKLVSELKPGDYIWVSSCGTELPVMFNKLTEGSMLHYQFIDRAGKLYNDNVFSYLFIRKATDEELDELRVGLNNILNFLCTYELSTEVAN